MRELSDEEFLRLLPIYADRLRNAKHYLFLCAINADISVVSFDDTVQTLLKRARSLGSGAEDLALAYSEYLVKRLGANRCNGRSCKTYDSAYIPMALKHFNEETRGLAGVPVPAISKEEVAKFSVLPSKVKLESPDGDVTAQQIQQQISRLRFGSGETYKADGLSAEERKESAWQKEAQRLLREIEAWPGVRPELPEVVFHRKINLYETLLGSCPAGSLRDQVLERHVTFLAGHWMETAHPIEWLRWVDRLLHPNFAPLKSIPKTQILDLWSASGDPVLGAYATLERLADPALRDAR